MYHSSSALLVKPRYKLLLICDECVSVLLGLCGGSEHREPSLLGRVGARTGELG